MSNTRKAKSFELKQNTATVECEVQPTSGKGQKAGGYYSSVAIEEQRRTRRKAERI